MGSQGQQKKQDQQNQGQEQAQNQARDARKQLGQEQNKQRGKSDPKSGEKSPRDPARDLPKGGQPDDPEIDQPKRKDDIPAWMVSLPPEIRDALAGGRAEEIPAHYRHLIRRYHLWLQKQAAKKNGR